VKFDSIWNFKDIGGWIVQDHDRPYHVRPRYIFQCGTPASGTEYDINILTQELRIKTLIDLRNPRDHLPDENDRRLYYAYPKEQIYTTPLSKFTKIDTLAKMTNKHLKLKRANVHDGENSVSENTQPAHTDTFLTREPLLRLNRLTNHQSRIVKILNIFTVWENYPILLFCNAGKDESSLIAALLLGLLGVDDRDIADDYSVSHQKIPEASVLKDHLTSNLGWTDLDFQAPKEIMVSILYWISKNHGSIPQYLDSIGFNTQKQSVVKHCLLVLSDI